MNKKITTEADNIKIFFEFLKNITIIPQNELDKLSMISKTKYIKKGDYFLRQGNKTHSLAFVIKGLFRITYLTEEGKEFTKSFLDKNDFLVAYSSLLQDKESSFSIEALENSTIIEIDYHQWINMFEDEISWNKLLITILNKAFCKKEEREKEFLLYDAQTRYENFLKNNLHLLSRIKQNTLASYLGITPVALSNLKNNFIKLL